MIASTFIQLCLVCLSLTAATWAAPFHADSKRGSLLGGLGGWAHQEESHPVHKLIRRQNASSAAVGSTAWQASYPQGPADSTQMPQAWIDALNNLQASGQIPNISLSNSGVYPEGVDATSEEVCSSYIGCQAPGDVWNAPDGMIGISFDDGPTAFSPTLYDFLGNNSMKATHFMIGLQILGYSSYAQQAYNQGDDLACHTWSHRYMTGLSNMDVVSEFGYALQIISDITGGRIPKFWRPPYGDSDNRIRAIASKIFGLTQVDWNNDSEDWELGTNQVTPEQVAASLTQWITGPKSPGLIILEHELTQESVDAFITTAYPAIKANGWDARTIPDLFGAPWYQNSINDTETVFPENLIQAGSTTINLTPTPTTDTPSTAAATASSTPSATAANKKNTASKIFPGLLTFILPASLLLLL